MTGSFLERRSDGLALRIRLTPRSSRNALGGVETGPDGRKYLGARVRAVPERGKANAALTALLADELGVPKSWIAIIAGHSSRRKTALVRVDADKLETLAAALEKRR